MWVPNKISSEFFTAKKPYHEIAQGLKQFVGTVEKDFFAETKLLFKYSEERQKMQLILDVCCNFGLTVGLHHFNKENWGGLRKQNDELAVSTSFLEAFKVLNEQNNHSLEIVEVSLNFSDTSIIITKLHGHSIPESLGQIITKLSEHFVYFTKGLTAMPYEVFVPVFEDTLPKNPGLGELESSYFDFWGIYFQEDGQQKPMVYSLKDRKFCKEDLFLLE